MSYFKHKNINKYKKIFKYRSPKAKYICFRVIFVVAKSQAIFDKLLFLNERTKQPCLFADANLEIFYPM